MPDAVMLPNQFKILNSNWNEFIIDAVDE